MKSVKLMLQAMLILVALLITSCSKCMTPPTNDSAAPVTTLRVSFNDSAGNSNVEFVNTTDHNAAITVHVPAGQTFTIAYAGNDDGGVKSLHLDYQYWGPEVNGLATSASPDLAIDDFSGCALDYRLVAKDYQWRPSEAVQYKFTAMATDFHSNTSTTPAITVLHGQ
jgi:hypothetical protein